MYTHMQAHKQSLLTTMLIAMGHLCTTQVLYRSTNLQEAVLYLTVPKVPTWPLFETLEVENLLLQLISGTY